MGGRQLLFRDRRDAGRQLAGKLRRYMDEDSTVLALPRGGVVVGYEVARALGAQLDVLVVRKLGSPIHPELGIGAVADGGVRVLDEQAIELLYVSSEYIEAITAVETAEMERRIRDYRDGRPPVELRDRTVILVDDGLATGVTARAAILAVRRRAPRRLVLAVPVCAAQTADSLRPDVDDLVCLHAATDLRAVGFWSRDFELAEDEEVIRLLASAARRTEG